MTLLVDRVGQLLTPELRAELQGSVRPLSGHPVQDLPHAPIGRKQVNVHVSEPASEPMSLRLREASAGRSEAVR